MIHIGICDDEKGMQKQIYDIVQHELFKYDDAEYTYYSSGKEVIEAIEADNFYCDLLLLDINMPKTDGLSTAKYIRECQVDVDIIFVTVSQEHVFDGYTFQAFSYLLKPIDRRRLSDEINRYMLQKTKHAECLHITINGRKEQVFLDRVVYFSGEGRKVLIHQRGKEEVAFYGKISDVAEVLKECHFIRCHQSYLLNQRFIKNYSKTEIELSNGECISVSRKYVSTIEELKKKGESV